jgi:hypothetical protein
MERINAPGGAFVDGNPFNGIQGTVVTADWLNSMQEEIVSVITAAGIALDPDDQTQLLQALLALMAIAGIATVNVAGNANVALTQAQWGADIIILTGALTGNIDVLVPAQSDQWIVANRTSGNFLVTLKTPAGTGVSAPQGQNIQAFCDSVNVELSLTDRTDDAFSFYMGNLT